MDWVALLFVKFNWEQCIMDWVALLISDTANNFNISYRPDITAPVDWALNTNFLT